MSTPCPDCGAGIAGATSCPACGLRLTGPVAARLWTVDQQLAALGTERVSLIARLHEAPETQAVAWAAPRPAATPARPRETDPRQVQNTLLALGALLLAGAGLVFAAVTYSHLGVIGRALVLLSLTGAAVATAGLLSRKALTASAEAVAGVALVLGAVDAWAARRAGLGDSLDAATYASLATGVLAVAAAAWASLVPLQASRIAAVVLAQGPLPLALVAADASAAQTAVALAVLAGADAALALLPAPRASRVTAGGFGLVWAAGAVGASAAAFADDGRGGAFGLVLLTLLAAGLATRVQDRLRLGVAATVPVLLAAAAWGTTRADLTSAQRPLVLVAVALVALQATALLPRPEREGPVLGALVVASAAVVAVAEGAVQAVAGPFTWIADAWSYPGTSARDAVAVGTSWDGSIVTVVVLAASAGAVLVAGALLDRVRDTGLPAAVLLGVAAVALPLGLATSLPVALAVLLALAAALCGVGVLRAAPALVGAGLGVAAVATAWSLATEHTTLAVLPLAAVLAAALAVRFPGALTGAALLLASGALSSYGVSQGLSVDQVGALLLVGAVVAVALSSVLPGLHRLGAEGAAAVAGATSIGLTATDPGWSSWSFAVTGLLAFAVAVRPDRRVVGYAGALLLAASSWVRLADAHVTAPEPYVLPLAVMALVLGHLRRRHGAGSFEAYGSGLTLALVPSLLASFDDPTPFRALLVLLAASAVVLVGGQQRLRAPLVIGGGVVVVDALNLLAPYAAALPRWVVLAVAGGLLVLVGATYEQRLRDVTRLRQRYEALS